jgi:hypothetical protein
MRTNLRVILSAAVGVATLLASPAMAKAVRHRAAPAIVSIPSDARGAVAPRGVSAYGALRSNVYESYAQGHQSVANPDRLFPAPDHN